VQGAHITGIELAPELVRLAGDNAGANGFADRARFVAADVEHSAPGSFDHVFFNPPFHPDTGQVSPSPARDRARRDVSGAVARWTAIAFAHVKERGTVTAILSAARTGDMLAAAGDHGATILPLLPHDGEAPKRIIVRIAKGAPAGLRTLPGFVLHTRSGGNTDAAEAVLRHAASLMLDG
jgi:tRNA1(Val) A37 N6-methylase TrmN6